MAPTLRLKDDELVRLRNAKGLTTDVALAAAMGINPTQLFRVLRQDSTPGHKFIAGMCRALDAQPGDLFEVVDGNAA
jgi:transcriptional regulator with XRE-family HTH domain